MPFVKYTAKKTLINAALSCTLAPMAKTYIGVGVIIESVIRCVRWAMARLGAFYIYGKFFKIFLIFDFSGKNGCPRYKGRGSQMFSRTAFRQRGGDPLEADKAGAGYCAEEIQQVLHRGFKWRSVELSGGTGQALGAGDQFF